MVINILQNWSQRYYSHYKIIKCVDFNSSNYAINLDIVSYSMVFSKIGYVFLSIYC